MKRGVRMISASGRPSVKVSTVLGFGIFSNVSTAPARYLAVAFGGLRYPFSEDKRRTFTGMDVSVREGGRQIEYEDQDPRIHTLYVDELRKRGIPLRMDEVPMPTPGG